MFTEMHPSAVEMIQCNKYTWKSLTDSQIYNVDSMIKHKHENLSSQRNLKLLGTVQNLVTTSSFVK